jgi:BMFP domain-containing protein YqiC
MTLETPQAELAKMKVVLEQQTQENAEHLLKIQSLQAELDIYYQESYESSRHIGALTRDRHNLALRIHALENSRSFRLSKSIWRLRKAPAKILQKIKNLLRCHV